MCPLLDTQRGPVRLQVLPIAQVLALRAGCCFKTSLELMLYLLPLRCVSTPSSSFSPNLWSRWAAPVWSPGDWGGQRCQHTVAGGAAFPAQLLLSRHLGQPSRECSQAPWNPKCRFQQVEKTNVVANKYLRNWLLELHCDLALAPSQRLFIVCCLCLWISFWNLWSCY